MFTGVSVNSSMEVTAIRNNLVENPGSNFRCAGLGKIRRFAGLIAPLKHHYVWALAKIFQGQVHSQFEHPLTCDLTEHL